MNYNEQGASTPPPARPVGKIGKARSISAGPDFAAAVDMEGRVWVWGSNMKPTGATPPADPSNIFSPTAVNGVKDAVEVAVGSGIGAALLKDGTVWAWGLYDRPQKIFENVRVPQ